MDALSLQMIGDLVMVLNIEDKGASRLGRHRRAARLALPFVALALVEKPALYDGQDFLSRAAIIRIIRFTAARQRHMDRMMKIVIPQRIQAESSTIEGSNQADILRLVFTDEDDGA